MKKTLSILVIEDSEDDFFLLKEGIVNSTEIEAKLHNAERLQAALLLAMKIEVDVAIIDLNLPDSFGLATFDTFHQQFPQVPAIIMTGARDQGMAYQAIRRGAQDFLFKQETSSAAIVRTIRFAIERHRLMTELQLALDNVKQLEGLLPICSFCKKIRNDKGYWNRIETYISDHTQAQFSHGLCPDCGKKHYGEYYSNGD